MVTVIRVLGLAGREVTLLERKLLPGPVRTPPPWHQEENQERLTESPTPSWVFLRGRVQFSLAWDGPIQDHPVWCRGRSWGEG